MEREKILTTSKKNKELKIGDAVYKYIPLSGICAYEVCGFLENSILVKSNSCIAKEHPCVVEINPLEGSVDTYKFVSLFHSCGGCVDCYDDENGEEVEVDKDYIFHHTADRNYFYLTKRKAVKNSVYTHIERHKDEIRKCNDEIEKLKNEIKKHEKRITELEVFMNELPD